MRSILVAAAAMWTVASAHAAQPWEKRSAELRGERLGEPYDGLKALGRPKQAGGPSEWLSNHEERGQSLAEYQASKPPRPGPESRTLYVVPIGDFSVAEKKVVDDAVRWIGVYFGLPVKTLAGVPLSRIPASARRKHPTWGMEQIRTDPVGDLLVPLMPKDALALIGLTTSDLYPDPDWNFVFGIAWPEYRLGLWSMYRFGKADGSPEERRACLRRMIGTAVHELSHMLNLAHCLAYECILNGCNNLLESDERPIDLCPACMAKLCWNVGCDPKKRLAALAALATELGLADDAKQLAAWRDAVKPAPARSKPGP